MYPSAITRLLLLLTTTASLLETVQADCYWPDGSENDAHQPCYAPHAGAVGLCCANGDVCMSNGVCMQASKSSSQGLSNGGSTAYYRGSCMFRDWSQGRNCPTVCLKGPGTSPHEAVEMVPCPKSDTDWYCADGNMKKANCSTGAYIVTLAKPNILTTVGVSPSMSGSPEPTTPPTALGGGFGSATTTSAPATTANSTAPAASGSASSHGSTYPAASTATEQAPGDSGSALPSPPPPPPQESSAPNSSSAVPLAVGVSIGGASLIGAGVIGYFLWRRRRDSSSSLARAETPPPRGTPDDDIMNPILAGSLFRSGSLIRRPSNDYLNTVGRTGPTSPEAVTTTASALGGDRASSMRSNSMRSNTHTQHHVRSASLDRFGADVVAMHDMRRTPPAGWGYPRGRNEPAATIPEIPYDGRRLPPYHGTPVLDRSGFYSELPG